VMLGNLAGWLAGVREQCGKQLFFFRSTLPIVSAKAVQEDMARMAIDR